MYDVVRTSQFKRDVKKALRRNKNPEKLRELIRRLVQGQKLPEKYRDHSLKGDYKSSVLPVRENEVLTEAP